MAVNNEVGAIYDINKLAKIVKENSKAAFLPMLLKPYTKFLSIIEIAI